jgi:hypothetical protein
LPKNQLSHYEVIANSFSVVEISDPIKAIVYPNESLETVWEYVMEGEIQNPAENPIILVRDENRIYGYLDFFDDFVSPNEKMLAGEKANPIDPDQLVPSSMPLLDLPSLFQEHYFSLVLTQNNISHFVSFQYLDKLPMKLCLFSLLMELEAKMLDLFMLKPEYIETLLHFLSNSRLQKAKALCKRKYKKESPERLLHCTTFTDKKRMLIQSCEISKLPFEKHETDNLFERIEEVRNRIAHSDSIIEFLKTPEVFNKFLSDLRKINNAMDQLLPSAGDL